MFKYLSQQQQNTDPSTFTPASMHGTFIVIYWVINQVSKNIKGTESKQNIFFGYNRTKLTISNKKRIY